MALSEKGKIKVQELIDKLGTRKTGVKLIDVHLGKLGISSSDLTDSTTFMYGLDAIDELLEGGDLDGAFESAKETAREMLEDEGFPGMYESVKPKKMKIVKYKKEFKSIDEALKKVPDILKENNKVFKITDGNKTIKVRWEGTLLEGNAVALMATDEKLIKEDVNNMKRLMGYKSENTLGNHNSKGRVMENDKFKELLSVAKKKKIIENYFNINLINESELLNEGVMDKMRTIALAIGMSIASFNAMAQNNPNKLIDTIKTEVNNLTPEQLAIIQRDTGINFTKDGAESLFRFEPEAKYENAPKLYLGQYGDKGLAKVTDVGTDGHGGYVYTVEVPNMSYIENGKIFRYVGKHNQNLDNSTINFTHKGTPVPKGNIKIR